MAEVLTQEEIDALLLTADSIEESKDGHVSTEIKSYDFVANERVSRTQMPTLEMLNEHFVRYLRTSMFSLMHQAAEVSLNGVQMLKFSEYTATLKTPTNLNLIRFKPLKGFGLIALEARLVFVLVDTFFGGNGRFKTKIEGREFTPSEDRIVGKLLKLIFSDYCNAWHPLLDTSMEFVDSEFNPEMIKLAASTDLVVINSFHIEMETGGGDFHITFPYSMLEPISKRLSVALQGDVQESNDDCWNQSMKEELMDVNVEFGAKLLEKSMPLKDIMTCGVGDIIPVDIPEHIILSVEDLPSYRCKLGKSRDYLALKISAEIPRPELIDPDAVIGNKS